MFNRCPVCYMQGSADDPLVDVEDLFYFRIHAGCEPTLRWRRFNAVVEDQTPYIAYLLTAGTLLIIFLQFIERLS